MAELDRKLCGDDPLSLMIDDKEPIESNYVTLDNDHVLDNNSESDEMDASDSINSNSEYVMLQPTRSSDSISIIEKWQKIINHEPQLLSGEKKTLDNIKCSLNTLAGGLIQGSLSMTNFRLIFIPSKSNLNMKENNINGKSIVDLCCLHLGLSYYQVPLASIHKIEKNERRDTAEKESRITALFLIIHCKDCRILKLQLPVCDDSIRSIGVIQSFAYARDIAYLFAFEHKIHPSLDIGWDVYDIEKEYKRQGVLKQWIDENTGKLIPCPWKLSMANYDYKVCGSYPELIVVPSELNDEVVNSVSSFRSEGRMPVLCWGYANNSGTIWRSSQPKVGVQGNTSKADELLLSLVASSVNYKSKFQTQTSISDSEEVEINKEDSNSAIPNGATTADATSNTSSTSSSNTSETSTATPPITSVKSPSRPLSSSARSISTALHSTFMSHRTTSKNTISNQVSNESSSTVDSSSLGKDLVGKPPVIHIIDCRPYTSAKANLLKGYGVESAINYEGSKISFMDMENIHSIRDSYQKLEKVCLFYNQNIHLNNNKDISWGTTVEATKWLSHMRLLLSCSLHVANIVHTYQEPVLVHCSHGWDRTPQVTGIAQLFLDPFYRTLTGFPVLIEKEFISFGHPFQKRLAHGLNPTDDVKSQDQICPIFLQFLDAVWQLSKLFVNLFEFNSRYILCIAEHLHSCRFGTFIMSTTKQRGGYKNEKVREKSSSIWSYLKLNHKQFINISYAPPSKQTSNNTVGSTVSSSSSTSGSAPIPFLPSKSYVVRNVSLWSDYFLRFSPHQCFSHESFISKQVEFDNDDEAEDDDDDDDDDDVNDDEVDDEDDDDDSINVDDEGFGNDEDFNSGLNARRRYSSVRTSEIGDIYMHEASLLSADQDENLHQLYDEGEKWKRKALYEQKIDGLGMLFGEESKERVDQETVEGKEGDVDVNKDNERLLEELVIVKEKEKKFDLTVQEKEEEIRKLTEINESQELKIKQLMALLEEQKKVKLKVEEEVNTEEEVVQKEEEKCEEEEEEVEVVQKEEVCEEEDHSIDPVVVVDVPETSKEIDE